MNRLLIFVGTLVFGYLFWFLGEALGFEFFGCFLLSGVGSFIGVYAGWKAAQRFR